MIDLTQTLPQRLIGARFTLYEKERCLYLYQNQNHHGSIFIAKLPIEATVLNVVEVAENYPKPKIGGIKRAVELGKDKKPYQKYILHACVICGGIRWVQLVKGKPKHLKCRSCARWKGGKFKGTRGYIWISLRRKDPFFPMTDSKGYVRTNRLAMAQHLGRCLYSGERVQTRNRIKTDVRIENLRLISKRAEPYGQPAGNGTWLPPARTPPRPVWSAAYNRDSGCPWHNRASGIPPFGRNSKNMW